MPRSEPRTHVLLIGIDDYRHAPLTGCVSDIDAVQGVLLGPRMAIPPAQITRLVAPRPGARASAAVAASDVADRPATRAGIVAALDRLDSDAIADGDRIFIYYPGHGARVAIAASNGLGYHRESLVPADYDEGGAPSRLLFDYELNQRLRAIAARTPAITVVLDCCHAAGVTRAAPFDRSDPRRRSLDLVGLYSGEQMRAALEANPDPDRDADADAGAASSAHLTRGPAIRSAPMRAVTHGFDACQVVAACMNHEESYETTEGGTRHGRLTRAFLNALDRSSAPDLTQLTWAQIWHAMLADVKRHGGDQHPWMSGPPGRAVFGGRSSAGDSGLPVTYEAGAYQIAAGELADVTRGAELAIYGTEPEELPALGSPADARARIGRICVTEAGPATASAVASGPAFDLPPGARGRVIKLGETPPLRYAIAPPTAELGRALLGSPLLARAVPPAAPEIVLRRHADRWYLTDAVHGLPGDGPTLFALEPDKLDAARAVLEHYVAYARPLRMAARCGDLPGCLELSILRVDGGARLSLAAAQAGELPEAELESPRRYRASAGDPVCFRVRNRSEHLLRVTLANAAASGKVQLLGDQIIDPQTHYVFWANGELGAPFLMKPPDGVACCADRLVAIGRTALDHDLEHLRVQRGFADVGRSGGATRDIGERSPVQAPLSHWTATGVTIVTRR